MIITSFIKNNNHNWIQDLVLNIFNTEFSKYLNARYDYRRLVLIRLDECYVCKKIFDYTGAPRLSKNTDLFERYLNNPEGLVRKIGWVYCNECSKYLDLAQIYIEANSKYLSNYVYKYLSKLKVSFFRISSNRSKKPYLETDATIGTCIDYLTIVKKNERLYANVLWNGGSYKLIYLSNLIYFNPGIFGYDYNSFPIFKMNFDRYSGCVEEVDMYKNKIWLQNWLPMIKKEYQIIDSWNTVKYLLLKRLNNDTINIIFSFWIKEII